MAHPDRPESFHRTVMHSIHSLTIQRSQMLVSASLSLGILSPLSHRQYNLSPKQITLTNNPGTIDSNVRCTATAEVLPNCKAGTRQVEIIALTLITGVTVSVHVDWKAIARIERNHVRLGTASSNHSLKRCALLTLYITDHTAEWCSCSTLHIQPLTAVHCSLHSFPPR